MAIRLYVGNLSYNTTQEDLAKMFAEAGNVTNASLMTDRFSGQSRGFGFVEMATDDEAQSAIRLFNGKNLGGRDIVVNEARPRAEGGGFSRGGSGGGSKPRSYGDSGSGGFDRGKRGGGNSDRYDRDRY